MVTADFFRMYSNFVDICDEESKHVDQHTEHRLYYNNAYHSN